jgi:hypothetical protein
MGAQTAPQAPVGPGSSHDDALARRCLLGATQVYKEVVSSLYFCSLSACKGFMLVSEDSSETAFLLVENYNFDCSYWPSSR